MFVYKITNSANGKSYIGLTTRTVEHRWRQHCTRSKQEKHRKQHLYAAMRKYGIEAFSVEMLCRCSSLDDLANKEIFYIRKYKTRNRHFGYNIAYGGSITRQPKEVREKIAKANTGRKPTESTKRKLRVANLGKTKLFDSKKETYRAIIEEKLSSGDLTWTDAAKKHNVSLTSLRNARLRLEYDIDPLGRGRQTNKDRWEVRFKEWRQQYNKEWSKRKRPKSGVRERARKINRSILEQYCNSGRSIKEICKDHNGSYNGVISYLYSLNRKGVDPLVEKVKKRKAKSSKRTPLSDVTKRKISEANRGKKRTSTARKEMSENRRGSGKYYVFDAKGRKFNGYAEAAESNGISPNTASARARNGAYGWRRALKRKS